jgi:DNA-binding transcriptional LysR family regulator
MTIRHLQIFMAVCRHQSITAAAEELNMTQPAVSVAIRELESYYQTRLFDRMNRRIYLTSSGETLRQYADTILCSFDEAAAVLREGGADARCALGVNVTVSETALPALLARLRAAFPALRAEVFVHNAEELERRLLANELDFAIADSPSADERLLAAPFYREEMAVLCAPGFLPAAPLPIRALAGQPMLLRESGSGSRVCVDAVFAAHGCTVRPQVESISDLSLLRLAGEGFGCTILPRSLAAAGIGRGLLQELPITDGAFVRHYFILRSRRKYESAAVRRAIEIVCAGAAGEAPSVGWDFLPRPE